VSYSKAVVVQGMVHARPAAALVRAASDYAAAVFIAADGREVDAKSAIGVMTLALRPGTAVTVTATGPDEVAAVEAVVSVLQALEACE
jgi:phosphotransferase system HPr (HPr) family protein